MSDNFKIKFLSVIACVLTVALPLQAADICYQSDFTGTNLADAGLASIAGLVQVWTLDTVNDYVKWPWGGNERASLYTTNSWQSDRGFKLDVTFNMCASPTRFEMGLVTSTYNVGGASYWLSSGVANAYGIGFAMAAYICNTGAVSGLPAGDTLAFNDGTGSGGDYGGSIKLSIDQGDVTSDIDQTLTITVTSNSWSYSLNGAPASAGTWSTPFDAGKNYRFCAYAQSASPSYISNITITRIPPGGTVIVVK